MIRNRYQSQRIGLFAALAILAAAAAGCSDRPATAEVRGKVLYKDGSVPQGGVCVVNFAPTDDSPAKVRKAASGVINKEDGSFELFTRKPGDGVFLGEYAVTFAVWKGPMEPNSLIQEVYTKSSTTPYHVTIEGDMDDLIFEIEPRN